MDYFAQFQRQAVNTSMNDIAEEASYDDSEGRFMHESSAILTQIRQQHSSTSQHQAKDDDLDEDEMLVKEIRKYRCLWDTSCRSFKDSPKKQQAWRGIAVKLEKDGQSK